MLGDGSDVGLQFLDPARGLDGPALVPEVPLDLTGDRRHRVRAEVVATVGIVTVNSLHQPDVGDLSEVLGGLAASPVAARDRASHVHVEQRSFSLELLAPLAATCPGL